MNKDQAKRLFVTACYGNVYNLRTAIKKDRLMVQEDWGIFTNMKTKILLTISSTQILKQ